MNPIADEFGHHIIVLENRSGQPRGTVTDWRHAVEQMRRLTRAGGDAVECLLVGCARVS